MLSKNRSFKNGLRGQYTLYALFMTVMTIIVFTQIYPILKEFIDDALPTMDAATATLLSISPFVIFMFILYGAMWYVIPNREQR
jgi:uncharacterized BrkB/YihY/UPF0761 family membrane protein